MARPERIDYPGAWHHVMNRGARREPIFRDTDDCRGFLDQVGEAVAHEGIEVHAYALMPNHYHLLVRSPHATLSRAMRRIGARHTARVNWRHGWDGPVFRGRFHNRLVTDPAHLTWLVAYLHLNPLRTGLTHAPEDEAWTSHAAYLGREAGPPWLLVERMLKELGGPAVLARLVRDVWRGRRQFPEDLPTAAWSAKVSPPEGRRVPPAPHESPSEVLAAVARVAGVHPTDLLASERGGRGNPARRFALWALSRSTTLSTAEMGAILQMSPAQAHNTMSRLRRGDREPVRSWQQAWVAGLRS